MNDIRKFKGIANNKGDFMWAVFRMEEGKKVTRPLVNIIFKARVDHRPEDVRVGDYVEDSEGNGLYQFNEDDFLSKEWVIVG